MDNNFSLEFPKKNVAVITLLPEVGKVFQFSRAKLQELHNLVLKVKADNSVKVLIFTGVNKVFAAGGSIAEMREIALSTSPVEGGCNFAQIGQKLMDEIEQSRLVTIAALNGSAVGGGCELALVCDCRIARSGIKLGQPEINIGVIPGWGGNRRLGRILGVTRAKYLICSGELISAEVAYQWGFIQEVVPADADILEAAFAMANKFIKKSARVLAACKASINAGFLLEDTAAQDLERRLFGDLFGTEDALEGFNAFLEKREPNFKE